jgi:hypothetical protein
MATVGLFCTIHERRLHYSFLGYSVTSKLSQKANSSFVIRDDAMADI